MKLVVLLLFAANLVLFGWLYTHQDDYRPTIDSQASRLDPAVERLRLLRERNATESMENTAAQSANKPPPEAQPAETVADVPVLPEPSATAPQADVTAAESETTADTGPPISDATPTDAVAPEMDSETATALPPVRICQIVGPFSNRSDIDALVRELTALGVEAVQRTSRMEQPSGYWVYLPTMPRAEAKRIADELAKKGVTDYFLGRQNSISLGVFSDKRTAEVRMREIAGLGYEPRLEPRFLTHEVYWLDMEEQSPNFISDDRWNSLLSQQEGVRRQSVACE